jgi:hypothetical protein
MKVSHFAYSLILPIKSFELQPDPVSTGGTLDTFLNFFNNYIDVKNQLSQSNWDFGTYLNSIDRRKKKIDHTQICEDKVDQVIKLDIGLCFIYRFV